MRLPGSIASAIRAEGDRYSIVFTREQGRRWLAIVILIFAVCIGFGVWGVGQQVELLQLREQTQLQSEQLKLLEQKTQILDEKMKTLESLDQELRQMVKGAEQGSTPQGGGATKVSTRTEERGSGINVTEMLSKVYTLDKKAQGHLRSFYTLRALLKDGSIEQIREWQNSILISRNGGTDPTKPSIWPTTGSITSTFGVREDPVYGGSGQHEGLDIANTYGTAVETTADGIVTIAAYMGGYGNLVEVNHGNGLVTRYGHNSTILVQEGQRVSQGDIISLMGSTGKSTGSHLHYEVRVNGVPVDPMLFLPIQ